MKIKEFKVGSRVHMNDEPVENCGTITALGCSRAHVSWYNGNSTDERLFDLTPIIPDTPRSRVANLIPYWCKKATPADLAAVRGMVQSAIDDCGLDATAEVAESNEGCVTLGHNPITAIIKIRNTYPAIRMRNGTVVKDMDTITVTFRREGGIYDRKEHPDMWDSLSRNRRRLSREKALAAGDAVAWDCESVNFKAMTNGKARDYRKRHWYPFEGGVAGYGIDHIGGHYGYADTWENLKPDFAAYLRSVAVDLGYAGKAWRKEVA